MRHANTVPTREYPLLMGHTREGKLAELTFLEKGGRIKIDGDVILEMQNNTPSCIAHLVKLFSEACGMRSARPRGKCTTAGKASRGSFAPGRAYSGIEASQHQTAQTGREQGPGSPA